MTGPGHLMVAEIAEIPDVIERQLFETLDDYLAMSKAWATEPPVFSCNLSPRHVGSGSPLGPTLVSLFDGGLMMKDALLPISQSGVQDVVIFSGHFADEQLDKIDAMTKGRNATGRLPQVKTFAVNRAGVPRFPPDHAGLPETTLLAGLTEGLIDISGLGSAADDVDRFDLASPLWGIVGPEPREMPPSDGAKVDRHLVSAIKASVDPKLWSTFRCGTGLTAMQSR